MKECVILINTCNRATECCLLLQSLRTQKYQDFDVFILEDKSNIPLPNFHFYNCLITRMKLENHKVFYRETPFNYGVSKARQEIVNWARESNYKLFARLDDDVIIESDFLSRLKKIINKGYELASGVTAPMMLSTIKRDPKYLNGIINRVILDDNGNYVMNGD